LPVVVQFAFQIRQYTFIALLRVVEYFADVAAPGGDGSEFISEEISEGPKPDVWVRGANRNRAFISYADKVVPEQ
jgi:hypothetical protein